MPFPRSALLARLAALSLAVAGLTACSLFRGSATKQQLDPPPPPPHHPVDKKFKPMVVDVTTDASGAVTQVEFVQGSGSDAVDNYVAENIRHTWPGGPSTRSRIELTYSPEKKFSEPKLISSSPAP